MLHPIQRIIIPPLLKLVWIKKIEGIKNIPLDGKFVATPNHQSFFDDWIVPSIIAVYLNRELHMYVNRKYFRNPLFRWYLNHHKCIPVEVYNSKDKKEVNEKAFWMAMQYLEKNEPICIYPEGHRSRDGKLQIGKLGAARLAITARVPVLPIGIIGTREVLPKGKIIPKIKKVITVKIGKPIYFKEYYEKGASKKILIKATNKIMREIGKLIGQKYKNGV